MSNNNEAKACMVELVKHSGLNSFDIPPVVERTSGVEEACSTSLTLCL